MSAYRFRRPLEALGRHTLAQHVDRELAARMPDRDDLDQVGAAPVDDPIRIDEEFPDVVALQFRNDPSAVRECLQRLDLVEKPHQPLTGGNRTVCGDERYSRINLLFGLRGPDDSHGR